MSHETHYHRVLLATNEGPLHLSLYPDSHPSKPGHHFLKLVEEDVYDGSQLQAILPKFFVEFVAHKVGPTLSTSHQAPTVSFDKPGIVALGPKNQIVISLDRCDAIEQKYFVIGEIDDQDIETLANIGLYETDANHNPFTPLQIICAKILHSKTPGSPDVNPKKRKNTFKEPAPALTRQSTSPFKRQKTTGSPNSSGAIPPPPSGPEAFDLSKQASVINDEQQAIKVSPIRAAIQQSDPSMFLSTRSMSAPDMRSLNIAPKWPTRLVIVRHGESEHNAVLDLPQIAENIDAVAKIRDADVRLTQRGILQSRHTGMYLSKTEKFDICFVSPYFRTKATAEEISRQLPYNMKIYQDNTIREKEFGRLHGLQAAHVKDRFPEEFKARERDGKYWYRFPGGENYPDVEMRVMSFLERLSREYAGRSVLVVTHQVPYKMIRAVLQHLDENQVLGLEAVANCGIQEYILDRRKSPEGRLKLKTFNYVAYDADVIEKELTFSPSASSSHSPIPTHSK